MLEGVSLLAQIVFPINLHHPDMTMSIAAWHNNPYVSILLNCKQEQSYGGGTVWMLAARMMADTCYF